MLASNYEWKLPSGEPDANQRGCSVLQDSYMWHLDDGLVCMLYDTHVGIHYTKKKLAFKCISNENKLYQD